MLRNLIERITAEPRAESRGLDPLVHGRLARVPRTANGRRAISSPSGKATPLDNTKKQKQDGKSEKKKQQFAVLQALQTLSEGQAETETPSVRAAAATSSQIPHIHHTHRSECPDRQTPVQAPVPQIGKPRSGSARKKKQIHGRSGWSVLIDWVRLIGCREGAADRAARLSGWHDVPNV